MTQAAPPPPSPRQSILEAEKVLYSEQKVAFLEALESFYLRGNHSGRLMFRNKWPVAAARILPEELVQFDHVGVNSDEDRARRSALEEQAEEKRAAMAEIFSNMTPRLVVHGSLQMEELKKIMVQIDRELAECVFEKNIVERFFPPQVIQHKDPETDTIVNAPLPPRPEAAQPSRPVTPAQAAAYQTTPPPAEISDLAAVGHTDHSLATRPQKQDYGYRPSAQTNSPARVAAAQAEAEEAMDWLNTPPEDDLDQITPISTSAPDQPAQPSQQTPATPPAPAPAAPETQSIPPASPPPATAAPSGSMGLRAYQAQNQDTATARPQPPQTPPGLTEQPAAESEKKNYPPIPGSESSS